MKWTNKLKSICAEWVHGMGSNFKFDGNTMKVLNAMDDKVQAVLEECAGELESQVKRNSRVDTGNTKNRGWQHKVTKDGDEHVAFIGSNLENAIWEEFGTGVHAVKENGGKGGRQTPWYVPVEGYAGKKKPTYNGKVIIIHGENGKDYYKTNGKKPSRAFWNAYSSMKNKIIKRIQNQLKGI